MSLYYDTSRPPEHVAPHEELTPPQGASLTRGAVCYAGGVPPSTAAAAPSSIKQGSFGEYLLPN
eukprot:12173126-Heterocapsa_arctica.AAC.1